MIIGSKCRTGQYDGASPCFGMNFPVEVTVGSVSDILPFLFAMNGLRKVGGWSTGDSLAAKVDCIMEVFTAIL